MRQFLEFVQISEGLFVAVFSWFSLVNLKLIYSLAFYSLRATLLLLSVYHFLRSRAIRVPVFSTYCTWVRASALRVLRGEREPKFSQTFLLEIDSLKHGPRLGYFLQWYCRPRLEPGREGILCFLGFSFLEWNFY